MKRTLMFILITAMIAALFTGCSQPKKDDPQDFSGTQIVLADSGITVDGAAAANDSTNAVYIANDIVYYEAGHDFTYGEGTEADAHSAEEAAAHTVVYITQPGQYILSGQLNMGQIAIDLGEDAEKDPNAVVTLVLCGVDISCQVAPAIIFYNVYECGSKDEASATANVDTSKAGANLLIADGSENTVHGAYVARIYKPGTVTLSEDGKEVMDAKKLHKYDGAVYSKMSMNVGGGSAGTGKLNIHAANEGLDSELHLTVNGGNISIDSGNDGINTNEDNISVTTINGGSINILVNGSTGEGDGIDSNGWLVINGGSVFAQGCATSGDAGIDSDKGIHINGGTLFATGNMLDRISQSQQTYAVFQLAQSGSGTYTLKNTKNKTVCQQTVANSFTYLVVSSPDLKADDYTLWAGDAQLEGIAAENMGGQHPGGMMPPDGMEPPEGNQQRPEGQEPPEGMTPPEGNQQRPEGQEPPEGMEPPEGQERPEGQPEQGGRPDDGRFPGTTAEASAIFSIQQGENYFVSVRKTAN